MFETIVFIILIAILYALSAFFSGSEAAFFALKTHELESMGSYGKRARQLLNRPRRLLIVILFANLLVNTFSASLLESVFEKTLGTTAILPAIAIATILVLLFGEALPKTFCFRHKIGFVFAALPFIELLEFLLKPVVTVVFPATQWMTKIFEGGRSEGVTEDDIRHIVSKSEDEGILDAPLERWIHSIFALDKKRAVDVMVPKEKLIALPRNASVEDALEIIRTKKFSRIPLYAGTLDHIVGILYAKDILMAVANGEEAKPARIAREPIFVPRWKRCDILLNDLRARKTHMAVVVDEFGNTLGIIALDSILAEIVGTLRDIRREEKR